MFIIVIILLYGYLRIFIQGVYLIVNILMSHTSVKLGLSGREGQMILTL